MKKYFLLALVVLTGMASSCKYDDDEIWDSVNNLADRVASLEAATKQMNSDIAAMKSIITALQNQVSVSEVEELKDGYIIHFSDGTKATIKNGADGKDGANGADGKDGADGENGKDGQDGKDAPIVGVAQEEGVYYWTMTIDGKTEWLTDEEGNKLRVSGEDGEDGKDGIGGSGSTGATGADGKAPVVTITTEGYWAINGVATTVKAKGDKGADAQCKFSKVDVSTPGVIKVTYNGNEYSLPLLASVSYTLNGTVVTNVTVTKGSSETLKYSSTLPNSFAEIIGEEKVSAELDPTKNELKITGTEVGEGKVVILFYNANQTITSVLKVTVI